MIDDYLSVRGLRKQSERYFADIPDGAALYELALKGDDRAKQVFKQFGTDVFQAIRPFLLEFRPDAMVLGGRISRSFCFFGEELETFCKRQDIRLILTDETSRRAMEGLYVKFQETE